MQHTGRQATTGVSTSTSNFGPFLVVSVGEKWYNNTKGSVFVRSLNHCPNKSSST